MHRALVAVALATHALHLTASALSTQESTLGRTRIDEGIVLAAWGNYLLAAVTSCSFAIPVFSVLVSAGGEQSESQEQATLVGFIVSALFVSAANVIQQKRRTRMLHTLGGSIPCSVTFTVLDVCAAFKACDASDAPCDHSIACEASDLAFALEARDDLLRYTRNLRCGVAWDCCLQYSPSAYSVAQASLIIARGGASFDDASRNLAPSTAYVVMIEADIQKLESARHNVRRETKKSTVSLLLTMLASSVFLIPVLWSRFSYAICINMLLAKVALCPILSLYLPKRKRQTAAASATEGRRGHRGDAPPAGIVQSV
eukprot:226000-Pleurochrysis_carterae.AAC.4